jgi:hypothetical protein
MGKEGIRIVTQVLSSEGIDTEEDAQRLADYYLQGYRFIYANPDDDDVSVSLICLRVYFITFSLTEFTERSFSKPFLITRASSTSQDDNWKCACQR